MELAHNIAYLLKEARFNIHVDVFESRIKPQLAAFDLLPNGDEPRNNEFRLFLSVTIPCLASILTWAIKQAISCR